MTKRSADGLSGFGDDPTANHPTSAFFPASRQVGACPIAGGSQRRAGCGSGRSRAAGVSRMKNGLSGRGEAVAGAPFRGAGLRVRRGWMSVWRGRRASNPRPSPWQDVLNRPQWYTADRQGRGFISRLSARIA